MDMIIKQCGVLNDFSRYFCADQFFRGRETVGTVYFEKILEEQKHFCINEFIYQQILQGSKDEKEFAVLKSYLMDVPLYSLKRGIQSFENAALLNFRCRRKGATIRSTVDLLIAETAIENNIPLLHDDDDFANMARIITELKLVVQIKTPNTVFKADKRSSRLRFKTMLCSHASGVVGEKMKKNIY